MNSNSETIYKDLEASFLTYQKLASVPISDNKEVLVDAAGYGLTADFSLSAIPPSTGDKLMLRSGVCERLVKAQEVLTHKKSGHSLVLVYAYRSPAIQKASFEKIKAELGFGDRTDEEALTQAHWFVAVPEVAGHPTGGAIDLLIADEGGRPLDFGTPIHTLEKNSYVFSPFISMTAWGNRQLLRETMMEAGFAPFDGEWWHFSYGDREWAAYYEQGTAHYAQMDYTL